MRPADAGSTGTSRQHDEPLALFPDDGRESFLELLSRRRIVRQEAHRDAVAAPLGEAFPDDRPEERVGDLHQDPGSVARARIGPRSAAMLEVLERLERPSHGLVQGRPVEPRDERDPTRVVLVVGGVEVRSALAHLLLLLEGWKSAGLEIRGSTHTISPRLPVSSADAIAKHDFKD